MKQPPCEDPVHCTCARVDDKEVWNDNHEHNDYPCQPPVLPVVLDRAAIGPEDEGQLRRIRISP